MMIAEGEVFKWLVISVFGMTLDKKEGCSFIGLNVMIVGRMKVFFFTS